MNTIIQKRIEAAAKKYCQDKNYMQPLDEEPSLETITAIDAFIKGAEWLLEHMWISVEEALPTRNEDITYVAFSEHVLVRIDFEGNIIHRTACYDYANKRWTMYSKFVTHWAEIPDFNE